MITYQDNTKIDYDEWKMLRNKSVGSSETGVIIKGSRWNCNLKIFYSKITGIQDEVDNVRAWLGKETEPTTLKAWRYYDGVDSVSISRNHRAGNQLKDAINKKVTIFNSKFPGRSSTPDAHIQPFGVYEGRKEGFLEIKNTQSYVLNSYQDKLPPENVFQLADQIMIGEATYGELFYFIDNRSFKGWYLDKKAAKGMQQMIMDYVTPFWDNVTKAKPLYNQMCEAKRKFNMKLAGELEVEIAQLEPPPQNSVGYLEYLTERYIERASGAGSREGTAAELELGRKHKELKKKIFKLEEQHRQFQIEIQLAMKEINQLDFGKEGSINFFPNIRGTRIFKNNIK